MRLARRPYHTTELPQENPEKAELFEDSIGEPVSEGVIKGMVEEDVKELVAELPQVSPLAGYTRCYDGLSPGDFDQMTMCRLGFDRELGLLHSTAIVAEANIRDHLLAAHEVHAQFQWLASDGNLREIALLQGQGKERLGEGLRAIRQYLINHLARQQE